MKDIIKTSCSLLNLSEQIGASLKAIEGVELGKTLSNELSDAENRLRSVLAQIDAVKDSSMCFKLASEDIDWSVFCDHGWGD